MSKATWHTVYCVLEHLGSGIMSVHWLQIFPMLLLSLLVFMAKEKTLRSSQDLNLDPLNSGQMLLPTELLELWHWSRGYVDGIYPYTLFDSQAGSLLGLGNWMWWVLKYFFAVTSELGNSSSYSVCAVNAFFHHHSNKNAMCSCIQWNYRGVHILVAASSIFPLGMAMCTCAVECYKGAFQSSPLLYTGKKG